MKTLNLQYIKELQKIEKEKGIKFNSIETLDDLIKFNDYEHHDKAY